MRRKLLLAGVLTTFFLVAKSQVGINTTTPTATLDVTAKNSTGTGSAPEGLLIPRVDRQKAQSMTGVPTSTLIYVNSIATGTAAGTAVNIDTAGYYYYNGTVWTKLNTPVNIYNADGTLTGNRTVTQGANTLAFTGTQTNAFSVNGKNFSVDAANSRVGIGTTAPSSLLSVQNSPGTTTNTVSAGIENCGIPCGQGISRNITLYNLNGTGGQFGEMAFIPSTSEAGLSGATITGIDRDVTNSYAGLQFFTRNATDFAPRLTIKSSGNIGIGTTNPTNKLHIESTTSGVLKIADGTQGTDKVLTSDASGVATWKALPAAPASTNIYNTDGSLTGNRTVTQGANTLAFTGTQTNAFSVDGNTLSVDAANGRVGVGTTTPDTKLTISTPDNSFGLNHTNGTINLKTYIGGGAAFMGTTTSNDLYVMTNNSPKMKITAGGNVGIGTSAPTEVLDVAGGNLKVRNINTNTSSSATDKLVVADANGVLKTKADLFIPSTSIIGFRTTSSADIAANTNVTVLFPNNPLLSNFTYNSSTGVYTALQSGYYQVLASVNKDISMNSPTGGSSVLRIVVNGNWEQEIINAFADGTADTGQQIIYVIYLNANDTLSLSTRYTRTSRITKANISVVALGG